jgi:hypothetical protein
MSETATTQRRELGQEQRGVMLELSTPLNALRPFAEKSLVTYGKDFDELRNIYLTQLGTYREQGFEIPEWMSVVAREIKN